MRLAYFDCFSGIAGDMTLACLVDAGVDGRAIISAVASLGLPCELSFETVKRGGFRANYARVTAAPEHAHRYLHHIEAMIDRSTITPRQNELAKRIFRRLGEAEAAAHGTDIQKVHFHEVGAVDSIVDIVGSAVGLDLLGVDRFEASPIPPGRGFDPGRPPAGCPCQAPPRRPCSRGFPLAESTIEFELTTRISAAIVSTVAEAFGPLPPMTIESIGLGAGTKEFARSSQHPPPVRLRRQSAQLPAAGSDRVWVLDDEPRRPARRGSRLHDHPADGRRGPRRLPHAHPDEEEPPRRDDHDQVLRRGARIPATSKTILFRETTTLGIRRYEVGRHKLKRQAAEVQTPFGTVKGKLGWLDGRPPTFSPEYEDCARVAREHNAPLREVYQAAHSAYAQARPVPSIAGRRLKPATSRASSSPPSRSSATIILTTTITITPEE